MKITKIILGILLFVIPIGIHVSGNYTYMMAPIGRLSLGNNPSFGFHSLNWYTDAGRLNYVQTASTVSEILTSLWMFDFFMGFPTGMSTSGILTTIILYALVLYIVLSFFKNKETSIIADILMIGLAAMAFSAFAILNVDFSSFFTTNVPLFGILAAILGILGLIFSIKSKPKRRRK